MLFLLFLFLSVNAADNTECSISVIPSTTSLQSSDSPNMYVGNRLDVYDGMMCYFFKGNGTTVRDQIKPYLQRNMQKAKRHSKLIKLEQLPIDKLTANEIDDDHLKQYINKKVSKALEEAFSEEHQIRMRYQQESQEKLTKNQVALITALTSLSAAIITAGVTIAVTMTT